jgi:hypothetical protein
VTADRDKMVAGVLPPALELMTAFTDSEEDPGFYWAAVQRVIGEALSGADPAKAMMEVLFGLSALSGILLDQLSEATGTTERDLLSEVYRSYLLPGQSPDAAQ